MKNEVKRIGDRRSEAPNFSFIASVSDCNTIFHVTLVMCVIPVCQGYLLTNPYTRNTNSRWTRAPLVITSPQGMCGEMFWNHNLSAIASKIKLDQP